MTFSNMLKYDSEDNFSFIFSYLTVQDLGSCGFTCKRLSEIIFKNKNIANDIWTGAEKELTGSNIRIESIATARDHCHLYVTASKFAKFCDESETMPEEGEMGIDVAHKLMNIMEMDEEDTNNIQIKSTDVEDSPPSSEYKKKAKKKSQTKRRKRKTVRRGKRRVKVDCTQVEGSTDNKVEISTDSENEPTETSGWHVMSKEVKKEFWKKYHAALEELTKKEDPKKEYDHEIFLRITRNMTNEIVGQGFVQSYQPFRWFEPLVKQQLHIDLGSPQLGINESPEFGCLCENAAFKNGGFDFGDSAQKYANSFRVAIIGVSKQDLSVRLIRCIKGRSKSQPSGFEWSQRSLCLQNPIQDCYINEFPTISKWNLKSFKYDSSRYLVSCSIGIKHCFCHEKQTISCSPLLSLSFREDDSFFFNPEFMKSLDMKIGLPEGLTWT